MSTPEGAPPPAAPAEWRPSGPATSIPAAPKGGPSVFEKMRRRLVASLITQGILLLVLVAAAIVARDTPLSARLYLWAGIIPVGFSLIFVLAYRRGVKIRRDSQWTREWEKADVKKAYRGLGLVLVLWIAGVIGIIAMAM